MPTEHAPFKGVCIGAGYFSPFHLDAWRRIPAVRIAALCDREVEKARARAQAFGVPAVYSDFREMLARERPDFVDIITPPASHAEICRQAGELGAAIVCQKPLAPDLETSRTIVAHAEARGVRLMVHDNWRFQPWYREIRRILGAGTLGPVSFAHFRMRTGDGWGPRAYLDRQPFFRDYPRLLMHETGVHFVDTFRYLFGEVERVYADLYRLNPVIRGEDSGQVLFRFASGTRAMLDANRYNENDTGACLTACHPRTTFGRLRLDGLRGHLRMDDCGDLRLKLLGREAYLHDYPHELRGFAGDSVHAALTHFVARLRDGEPFETRGRDYLRTLEVVEACYRSAATGLPEPCGPGDRPRNVAGSNVREAVEAAGPARKGGCGDGT